MAEWGDRTWRSIYEEDPVVLLRGIRATVPAAYESYYGRLRFGFIARSVDLLHSFTAFAFSAFMHILVVVLLAEFVYIAIPVIEETVLTAQLYKPSAIADVPSPNPVSKPEEGKFERAAEAPKVAEDPKLPKVPDAPIIGSGTSESESRPQPVGVLENTFSIPESDLAHLTGQGLFGNRGAKGRQEAVGRYGGNAASEAAVELGLHWLAAHQSRDGRWGSRRFTDQCPRGDGGVCGFNLGQDFYDPGTTGLAMLAFLGAGYTHQEGKFKDTVERGLQWLLRAQDLQGFFTGTSTTTQGEKGMYGHGIAFYALSEAAAITGDENLRGALEKAVSATVSAQKKNGGWYYDVDPLQPVSEFTLSVWQMMGLKAAEKAGVHVPQDVIAKAKQFIRDSTDSSGGVYYSHKSRITLGSTGAGMFARCMFGMRDGNALERGLGYLEQTPNMEPEMGRQGQWEYVYYWYYRTLASFQMQGRAWKEWNRKIRPYLVSAQRTKGHPAGSWTLIDYKQGGTVYATAMCILILETYYRYLPTASDNSALGIIGAVQAGEDEMTEVEKRRAEILIPPPAEVLAERRSKEIAELQTRIKSDRPEERYIAARRLAELKDKDSLQLLMDTADKTFGRLKASHILFVGKLQDERSLPWLMKHLDDPDDDIVSAACSSLTSVTAIYNVVPRRWKEWYADYLKKKGLPK